MAQFIFLIPKLDESSNNLHVNEALLHLSRFEKTFIIQSSSSSLVLNEKIKTIENSRSNTIPGFLNSAILSILSENLDAHNTFVCYLNPKMLERIIDHNFIYFKDTNINDYLIIHYNSQVLRFNNHNNKPTTMDIIKTLFENDNELKESLVTFNLKTILEAGGFDEKINNFFLLDAVLRCIELEQLDIMVNMSVLIENLFSDLDTSASRVFNKYLYLLKENEITHCMRRNLSDLKTHSNNCSRKVIENKKVKNHDDINIVIGFIGSSIVPVKNLLNDLSNLSENGLQIEKILILDNFKNNDKRSLEKELLRTNEKVLFINRTKIVGECQDGIYGEYLNNCQNKNSISFNRTVLQHWLYNEARIVNNPVVWILDDDIRMDYLTDEGSKLKLQPKDVIFEIDRVRGEGYDIALGPITGDPPIPGICMLRCQLLDFLFYLRLIEKYGIKRSLSKLHKFPNQSQDYHDFYYDLSEFRFDHLEQPFVNIHVLKDQKELLADRFHKVIKGKASFRPVFLSISDHQNVAKNPVRGANSFIFNLESLRNFPNISPIINGITARRSDSLWLTLNKYVQNMKIGSIDVPIRHERNFDKIHSLEKLAGDIYGSSFVKAINSFFQNHLPLQTKKCFQNEENRKKILRLFEFFLKRRIGNFVLTTYRIRGLIKIIKNVIHDSEGFSTVGRDINKLNELFIQLNIDNFVNEVAQYNPQDIIRFLEQMEENSSAYRSGFGD